MKKLDITPITNAAQLPIKKGTLQFLQDANSEIFAALMTALIGSSYSYNTMYVLYGCINSGSGANYIISAGAVFYQGEIFLVDSTSFSTTGSNVPIMTLITSQYTTDADPVTLTDSSVHNVHNIRKITVVSGAAGSGLVNFSSLYRLSFTIPAQLNATGSGVSGTYPNLVFTKGGDSILAKGSYYLGDITSVGTVTVPLGTTLATTDYIVMISMRSVHTGYIGQDVSQYVMSNYQTNSFDITIIENFSNVQQLWIDYIIFSK